MTLRWMLDTNIVSQLVRDPAGPVFRRLAEHGEGSVCISIMTSSELRYGAVKKGSSRLSEEIDGLLARIQVMPFEREADLHYARVRNALTRSGQPIGPVDYFIAAHALALDLTLVTANDREFSRVPGLRVENWLV